MGRFFPSGDLAVWPYGRRGFDFFGKFRAMVSEGLGLAVFERNFRKMLLDLKPEVKGLTDRLTVLRGYL
jgi:hypothetical protein